MRIAAYAAAGYTIGRAPTPLPAKAMAIAVLLGAIAYRTATRITAALGEDQ
jgi:hypothetical protein